MALSGSGQCLLKLCIPDRFPVSYRCDRCGSSSCVCSDLLFPENEGAFGKKLWWAAGGCVAAVVAVVLVFPGGFDTAMNKLFHPNADSHTIASMVSTDEGVKITTIKDEVLYLTINNNSGYTVQDADHKPITLTKTAMTAA